MNRFRLSDVIDVGEGVLCVVLFGLVLRIFPFRLIAKFIGRVSEPGMIAPERPARRATEQANPVSIAIERACRRVPVSPSCLTKSLAGHWMLRRRGVRSRIVFGVATGDRLLAHAWLMCDDAILLGGDGVSKFVPIAMLAADESI